MQFRHFLLSALLVFIPAAVHAADMTVSFKFDKSSKCSRTSPEIKVENIPAGTVAFKVKLRDLDVSWRHGGGEVANDGTGIIPKGALTDGYNGPCPPDGWHTYRFIVKAVNADDDTIAEAEADQRFP